MGDNLPTVAALVAIAGGFVAIVSWTPLQRPFRFVWHQLVTIPRAEARARQLAELERAVRAQVTDDVETRMRNVIAATLQQPNGGSSIPDITAGLNAIMRKQTEGDRRMQAIEAQAAMHTDMLQSVGHRLDTYQRELASAGMLERRTEPRERKP